MKKSLWKRVLALVLCLAMSAGYLPVPSLAEEPEEPVVLQEQQEEPKEETEETQEPTTEPTTEPTEESTEAAAETTETTEATEAPTEEIPEKTTEAPQEELTEEVGEAAAFSEDEENRVCTVNGTGYATLQEAFAALWSMEGPVTVTLCADTGDFQEIQVAGECKSQVTLDLAGYSSKMYLYGNEIKLNLTVTDSSYTESSAEDANYPSAEFSFNKESVSAVNLTIQKGKIERLLAPFKGSVTNTGGIVGELLFFIGDGCKVTGGPYKKITILREDNTLAAEQIRTACVPDGCYYMKADGTIPTVKEIGETREYYTINVPVSVMEHTHEFNKDGECTCGFAGVAKVGDTLYEDMDEAVKAAESGGTLVLLKDAEEVFCGYESGITLDLNGKHLTTLLAKRSVTIQNSAPKDDDTENLGTVQTENGGSERQISIGAGVVAGKVSFEYATLNIDGGIVKLAEITDYESVIQVNSGRVDTVTGYYLYTTLKGGPYGKLEITIADQCDADYVLNQILPAGCQLQLEKTGEIITAEMVTESVAENGNYLYTFTGPLRVHAHDFGTGGSCSCGMIAEAKIGNSYYPTLAEAFQAAASGSTVTLLADIERESGNYTVISKYYEDGTSLTLDLNGKKLFYLTFNNSLNFTVTDGSTGGEMDHLWMNGGSRLCIAGGTVKSFSAYGTDLTVSGGTLGDVYLSNAAMTVSGGTVKSLSMYSGSCAVTGGTVEKVVIQSGGTLTRNGGTVESVTVYSEYASSSKLSGGPFGKVQIVAFEKLTALNLQDFVAPGYYFFYEDNTPVPTEGILQTRTSDGSWYYYTIDRAVTVGEHTHDFGTTGQCSCDCQAEATIGSSFYSTLKDAFDAAKENDTVILQASDALNPKSTGKTLTLDLNGKTLPSLSCSNSAITVVDHSGSGGKIRDASMGTGSLTIESGTIEYFQSGNITVAGGTVEGIRGADSVTVSNGKVKNVLMGNAVKTLKITGGTVESVQMLNVDSLTLTNNGGTVQSVILTAGTRKRTLSGGPFDQVQIVSDTELTDLNLAQYAGENCNFYFTTGRLVKAGDFVHTQDGRKHTYTLSGPVKVEAHDKHTYDKDTGECACGESRMGARIGETFYDTLEGALADVQSGQTVTLLADVAFASISGKTITLDLNGKTLKDARIHSYTNLTVKDSKYVPGNASAAVTSISNDGTATMTVAGGIIGTANFRVGGTLVLQDGIVKETTLGGKATMTVTGGTVEKVEMESGSLENTGGTVNSVTLTTVYTTLSGGPFDQVRIASYSELTSLDLRQFVEDGSYFYYKDSDKPVLAADVLQNMKKEGSQWVYTIKGAVTVHKHTHDFGTTGICPCGHQAEVKIGDRFYETLGDAFYNAGENATVTMLTNASLMDKGIERKTLTLDLNGKKLDVLNCTFSTITVVDSSDGSCGKIEVAGPVSGTLTVEGGTIGTIASGTITVSGGTVEEISNADSVTVSGGTVGDIQAYAGSSVKVSGGKVTSITMNAFHVEVDVTGGIVESVTMCDADQLTLTNNGGTVKNVVITAGTYKRTLSGGPFEKVRIESNGELDLESLRTAYVAEGYYLYNAENKVITAQDYRLTREDGKCIYTFGGSVSAVEHTHKYGTDGLCSCGDRVEAKIGDTYYATLQDAFNGAESGNTVTMLANSSETVTSGADIALTLNLNGKTLAGLELTGSMHLTLTGGGKVQNVILTAGTNKPTLSGGPFDKVQIKSDSELAGIDLTQYAPDGYMFLFTTGKLVRAGNIAHTQEGSKHIYTVSGPVKVEAHTHSYDGTTHECSCGESDKAAKIGSDFYDSLSGAINDKNNNATITLLQDVDGTVNWNLTSTSSTAAITRTLDLNGRHIGTLRCNKMIILTVKDSAGGGTIDSIELYGQVNFYGNNTNKVTLESGEIKNAVIKYKYTWAMTGGTVGTLTVAEVNERDGTRTIKISGGTVKNLSVSSEKTQNITVSGDGNVETAKICQNAKLNGGPYGKIRFTSESSLSGFDRSTYLKTGYGFAAADGTVRNVELEDGCCVVKGPVTVADVYHNFDANGLCGNCDNTAAAKVDSTFYMTPGDALAAIGTEQKTIVLQRNVTETFQIPQGASPTLDLNGKTIASIQSAGSLTVTDSSGGGTITSLRLTGGTAAITGGTVTEATVEAGTLENSGGTVSAVTVLAGSAKLSGGSFGQVRIESGEELELKTFRTALVAEGYYLYDANNAPISAAAVLATKKEENGRCIYTIENAVSVAAHTHKYDTNTGDCPCGDGKVAWFRSNYDYVDHFYDDLQSALNAASDAEVVFLLKDVEGDYTLRNSCWLLLDGHTIQGTLSISDGESTVRSWYVNSSISAIRVSGAETKLELDGQIKVDSLSMERGYVATTDKCEIQNATLQNDATLLCNFSTVYNLTFCMTQNSHPKLQLQNNVGTYYNVRILSPDPLEALDLSEFADGGCFRIDDKPISAATVLQNVSQGKGEEEGYSVYSLGDGEIWVDEDHIFEPGAVRCICGGLAEAMVGNTPYSSFEEAVDNCNGGTVILMKDAIVNNEWMIYRDLTIDWNGHKMQGLQLRIESGTTTLMDSQGGGSMRYGDGGDDCITLQGGFLVIESGDYYGIYNYAGSVIVNGGTFHACTESTLPLDGSIQVRTGYAFYDQDNQLVDWTNGFAEGSTVTLKPHTGHTPGENGQCTVCGLQYGASVTAGEETSYYDTLQAAITAAAKTSGGTVKLYQNGTDVSVPSGSVTLDLNGHTVASIQNAGSLTVTDSSKGGTVSAVTLTAAGAKLSGGPFGQVSIESNQALDLDTFRTAFVPSGCYFHYADGTPVSAAKVLAEGKNNTYTIQGPVSVVKHTHSYNKTTGDCPCGVTTVAAIVGENGTYTFYETLEEALTDAGKMTGPLIVLLKDVKGGPYQFSGNAVLSLGDHKIQGTLKLSGTSSTTLETGENPAAVSDIEISGSVNLTLSGPFTIDSLYLKENGSVIFGGGSIQSVTMEGGTLYSYGTVESLMIISSDNLPKLVYPVDADDAKFNNVRIVSTVQLNALNLSDFVENGGCLTKNGKPISAADVLKSRSQDEKGNYVYSIDGPVTVSQTHTYDSTTGLCPCGDQAAAKVDGSICEDFDVAVGQAGQTEGSTLVLLRDVVSSYTYETFKTKSFTIDWNGHTADMGLMIEGGNIILKDSVGGGGIRREKFPSDPCIVLSSGELTIEGGSYDANGTVPIQENQAGAFDCLTLPAGYVFYDQNNNIVENWKTNGFAQDATVTVKPHRGHTLGENGLCTVCGSLGTEEGLSLVLTEELHRALGDRPQINGESVDVVYNACYDQIYLSRKDGKPLANAIFQTYTWGENSQKEAYPTGMKVYRAVENENRVLELREETALEDLLMYIGVSIRCAGETGIRISTGMTRANKTALTGEGLDGFKLVKYGTVAAWSDYMGTDTGLVLGKSYSNSGCAYNRDTNLDKVFKDRGTAIEYTNVLVNYPINSCCAIPIVFRPFAVLEREDGTRFTIYGGEVRRTISGIAQQVLSDSTVSLNDTERAYVQSLVDAGKGGSNG